MTPEPKYLTNLVIDTTVACVSDSDPEDGEMADVLEDTVWDGLPILRPEGEAGSKRRGDGDDEDGGDAEIECRRTGSLRSFSRMVQIMRGFLGRVVCSGGYKKCKGGENPCCSQVMS